MNKNIPTPLAILIILLVIAIIVGISLWLCSEKETVSPQDETADWQTYSGNYFSFKHPYDWSNNTGPASSYPDNLEVIGLRISPNAVFEASYKNNSYESYIQNYIDNGRQGEKLTVAGKRATKFELAGTGETLPVGFSIISIVVEGSEDTSYVIVFDGDGKDVTEELINQILSTFRFIEPEIISEEEAINLVKNLPEVKEWLSLFTGPGNTSPTTGGKPMIVVDNKSEQGYSIHVYEQLTDHAATFNWYSVNSKTGEIILTF